MIDDFILGTVLFAISGILFIIFVMVTCYFIVEQ